MLLIGVGLWHGPIAQPVDYHGFADQQTRFGIAHFADVVSNLGFAIVAVWGWLTLFPSRDHSALANGWDGYGLFLAGLFFTAIGSACYHLSPDNVRLLWDRIPIALACGGLLAGVWGDVHARSCKKLAMWFALAAFLSVGWWYYTELKAQGDLRPYLLFQVLPVFLIPVWQWLYRSPLWDRLAMGGALVLYIIAKVAELLDYEVAALVDVITGHTLKHLLATLAAGLIVFRLIQRTRQSPKGIASRRS